MPVTNTHPRRNKKTIKVMFSLGRITLKVRQKYKATNSPSP